MCTAQMAACVSDADNVRTSSGSVTACTYLCTATARACGPADGFCPTGCGPTRDIDCPGCGNGRVESGETCDPSSTCMTQMTACVSDANNVRTSSGSVTACTYVCTTTARACGPADGFCPTGCGPTMDVDCPGCGNGRIESGETCDVSPAAVICSSINCNDGDACTTDTRTGANATCNVACTHAAVTACTSGDGCCPSACNRNNDTDCAAVCGNGVVESGETCDVSPATVICSAINCNDGDACTTDTRTGANATCNVACTHAAITACTTGDGCCPGGGLGACNRNNDTDCAAVCGNGAVETGETCDTAIANSCPTSCAQQACVLPQLVNRGTCTAACVDQGVRQTMCVDGDGCCPGAPTNCSDINDTDCPTPNDTCPNARDISAGGDFPFSLMTAKEETPGQCSPDGPEVFFQFTVPNPSAVYLDVFDPSGKRVDVALEVWANGCPTATTKPIACDTADGGRSCGGETWPRIFFTNTDLRTYVVVARAMNGTRGRYSLRLQYVPLACIGGGAFPVAATQPLIDTTCGGADLYAPSCTAPMTGGLDKSYYLVKCPAQTLSISTCEGRTGNTDTVLYVNRGNLRLVQGACSAVAGPIGREIACNDDRTGVCAANPNNTRTSEINGAGGGDRGIFTITVDTHFTPGIPNCGPFGLNWALK
ncbi:MAG TPA: hypothetical protein VN903_38565, partial [Polyangia bacterium]|nr:hypothetical protein [Polyangia bacterium]